MAIIDNGDGTNTDTSTGKTYNNGKNPDKPAATTPSGGTSGGSGGGSGGGSSSSDQSSGSSGGGGKSGGSGGSQSWTDSSGTTYTKNSDGSIDYTVTNPDGSKETHHQEPTDGGYQDTTTKIEYPTGETYDPSTGKTSGGSGGKGKEAGTSGTLTEKEQSIVDLAKQTGYTGQIGEMAKAIESKAAVETGGFFFDPTTNTLQVGTKVYKNVLGITQGPTGITGMIVQEGKNKITYNLNESISVKTDKGESLIPKVSYVQTPTEYFDVASGTFLKLGETSPLIQIKESLVPKAGPSDMQQKLGIIDTLNARWGGQQYLMYDKATGEIVTNPNLPNGITTGMQKELDAALAKQEKVEAKTGPTVLSEVPESWKLNYKNLVSEEEKPKTEEQLKTYQEQYLKEATQFGLKMEELGKQGEAIKAANLGEIGEKLKSEYEFISKLEDTQAKAILAQQYNLEVGKYQDLVKGLDVEGYNKAVKEANVQAAVLEHKGSVLQTSFDEYYTGQGYTKGVVGFDKPLVYTDAQPVFGYTKTTTTTPESGKDTGLRLQGPLDYLTLPQQLSQKSGEAEAIGKQVVGQRTGPQFGLFGQLEALTYYGTDITKGLLETSQGVAEWKQPVQGIPVVTQVLDFSFGIPQMAIGGGLGILGTLTGTGTAVAATGYGTQLAIEQQYFGQKATQGELATFGAGFGYGMGGVMKLPELFETFATIDIAVAKAGAGLEGAAKLAAEAKALPFALGGTTAAQSIASDIAKEGKIEDVDIVKAGITGGQAFLLGKLTVGALEKAGEVTSEVASKKAPVTIETTEMRPVSNIATEYTKGETLVKTSGSGKATTPFGEVEIKTKDLSSVFTESEKTPSFAKEGSSTAYYTTKGELELVQKGKIVGTSKIDIEGVNVATPTTEGPTLLEGYYQEASGKGGGLAGTVYEAFKGESPETAAWKYNKELGTYELATSKEATPYGQGEYILMETPKGDFYKTVSGRSTFEITAQGAETPLIGERIGEVRESISGMSELGTLERELRPELVTEKKFGTGLTEEQAISIKPDIELQKAKPTEGIIKFTKEKGKSYGNILEVKLAEEEVGLIAEVGGKEKAFEPLSGYGKDITVIGKEIFEIPKETKLGEQGLEISPKEYYEKFAEKAKPIKEEPAFLQETTTEQIKLAKERLPTEQKPTVLESKELSEITGTYEPKKQGMFPSGKKTKTILLEEEAELTTTKEATKVVPTTGLMEKAVREEYIKPTVKQKFGELTSFGEKALYGPKQITEEKPQIVFEQKTEALPQEAWMMRETEVKIPKQDFVNKELQLTPFGETTQEKLLYETKTIGETKAIPLMEEKTIPSVVDVQEQKLIDIQEQKVIQIQDFKIPPPIKEGPTPPPVTPPPPVVPFTFGFGKAYDISGRGTNYAKAYLSATKKRGKRGLYSDLLSIAGSQARYGTGTTPTYSKIKKYEKGITGIVPTAEQIARGESGKPQFYSKKNLSNIQIGKNTIAKMKVGKGKGLKGLKSKW